MSLDHQGGTIWFCCDFCSETLDSEESDFSEAVATMRGAGWSAERVPGDPGKWRHRCPACHPQEAA